MSFFSSRVGAESVVVNRLLKHTPRSAVTKRVCETSVINLSRKHNKKPMRGKNLKCLPFFQSLAFVQASGFQSKCIFLLVI